jgi:UDP-galactose transporter B1
MAFGIALGKKYPLRKYVNVMIITCGVALFMGGGSSTKADSGDDSSSADSTLIGALMLSLSLCFDGATGAYEDKLMGNDHVGPFDLMFNIQLGKSVISFIALVAMNELGNFVDTLKDGVFVLFLLGLTGAFGQVFVFLTISKFGALNCALIGLFRKMLSLILSLVLFGHSLNAIQTVGLALSLTAMIANFYDKGSKKKKQESPKKDSYNTQDDGVDSQIEMEQHKPLMIEGDEDEDESQVGDKDRSAQTV